MSCSRSGLVSGYSLAIWRSASPMSTLRIRQSSRTAPRGHPEDDDPLGGRDATRRGEARSRPTKLVANLPYNIATPIVVESLVVDPLRAWCVMVQREVADRFFAVVDEGLRRGLRTRAAGDRAHRAAPGLARRLPSEAQRRVGAGRLPAHRPWCGNRRQAARRGGIRPPSKDARQLALAGWSRLARSAADALAAIGRAANVRAEELEPSEFPALAKALG